MNVLIFRLAVIAFVALLALPGCGPRLNRGRTDGPDLPAVPTTTLTASRIIQDTGVVVDSMKISPEEAFRRGILSLNGKVDLYDTNGIIRFHRSPRGYWFMQLSKYADQPIGGIWVIIRDDGKAESEYGF